VAFVAIRHQQRANLGFKETGVLRGHGVVSPHRQSGNEYEQCEWSQNSHYSIAQGTGINRRFGGDRRV
jgi:hypothetical protein